MMTGNSAIKALSLQNINICIKCTKVEQRFSSFVESVAFSNILLLLDTKSWPKDDFVSSGNREINKLTEQYMSLLKKNGCDVTKISREWTHLKTYIFSMFR